MAKLLENINSPEDIHNLTLEQLETLAQEVRQCITHTVSNRGGHLASNLGVVELTIAMHSVFDFKKDKLLWDVGHQCYAHKILTGRREQFSKLRQENGLSGFPSPAESEYDTFAVGHAGTSIATAIGMALGAQEKENTQKIVAMVGDASIVNGASFEALNNLGLVKRQMLIVLNDNSMAIDVTQGSIAKFLSKVRLSHTYEDIRRSTNNILEHLPVIGRRVEGALENFKKTLRMAISPSRLFESLNIPYFGPVDGHDIESLKELFRAMEDLHRPAILHVYTKKGMGFTPADEDPRRFHSTGPFDINGIAESNAKGGRTYTAAFGDSLVELAKKDDTVIAITAAMPDGTGLANFRDHFPDRYYDVGIAESAAVDIAAGLAAQGKKPFVCIYSTFLQRSYDQIFQEVALANMPVVLCIDRGGFVGDDGPTHHGMTDIGFLRMMPNMTLISPATENEMTAAVEFAASCPSPVAIRYPRDVVLPQDKTLDCLNEPFQMGKSVTVKKGDGKLAIVALGSTLAQSLKAAEILAEQNIEVTVINARFAKPIDKDIIELIKNRTSIITVEDHRLAGGFGSAILELAAEIPNKATIYCLGCSDEFMPSATRSVQLEKAGISPEHIAKKVKEIISTQ